MAQPANYLDNVFINCPFDATYKDMFEAMVFAIHDCGFIARCAREEDDGNDIRFQKIVRIIDECRYGIHDISKADLDVNSGLARFNMPLELGVFMGAQRYADKGHYNKDKKLMILDSEQYRYQVFISDLAGTDIASHENSVQTLIERIRSFLVVNSRRKSIASGAFIHGRFQLFLAALPNLCNAAHWDRDHLSFIEYGILVTEWIKTNPI